MISAAELKSPAHALPFGVSLAIVPLVFVAASLGGWWFLLIPFAAWWLMGALDLVIGSTWAPPGVPIATMSGWQSLRACAQSVLA